MSVEFKKASGECQRVAGVEFDKASDECRVRKGEWRVSSSKR